MIISLNSNPYPSSPHYLFSHLLFSLSFLLRCFLHKPWCFMMCRKHWEAVKSHIIDDIFPVTSFGMCMHVASAPSWHRSGSECVNYVHFHWLSFTRLFLLHCHNNLTSAKWRRDVCCRLSKQCKVQKIYSFVLKQYFEVGGTF